MTEALSKRGTLDSNFKHRLESISQCVATHIDLISSLIRKNSTFQALTACIEAKIERGMARRVLESRADVDEVNDIMTKITMRIEAFIVSAAYPSDFGGVHVLSQYESMIHVEIGVGDLLSVQHTSFASFANH